MHRKKRIFRITRRISSARRMNALLQKRNLYYLQDAAGKRRVPKILPTICCFLSIKSEGCMQQPHTQFTKIHFFNCAAVKFVWEMQTQWATDPKSPHPTFANCTEFYLHKITRKIGG